MNQLEEYTDMTQWLAKAAETDRGIEIFYSETEKKRISYRELLERSRKLLRVMKDSGIGKQDRVLLYCEDEENLLYGFWACAFGGSAAVMINCNAKEPLQKDFVDRYGFAGIVADVALPDPQWVTNIIDPSQIEWDALEEPETDGAEHDKEELLYVQFSSGTTGDGKAIPIRRRNLYASVSDECKCFRATDEDVILNWQPLTHSGGLVIYHMLGVYAGLPQYILPVGLYMKNPLLWMEMISRFRVTITGAVPYAMLHFLRFVQNAKRDFDWDLSSLRIVGIGAEQVNKAFLEQFYTAIKKYHFSKDALVPIYGLTEAVCLLAFSFGSPKTCRPEHGRINCGEKVIRADGVSSESEYIAYTTLSEHMEVRITDDSFGSLPEDTVGRVCIKGPAVVDGYLADGGALRTERFRDGWFDTGDIGALTGDGELVIMGRSKEIVVAGGANFECASLERCIDQIDSGGLIRNAFVCNVPDRDGVEQAVVFCVTDEGGAAASDPEFIGYRREVRSQLFESFGVTAAEVVPIREAPRSESGKLQRRELVVNYLNGCYDGGIKANEMSADVNARIHAILKEILDMDITDDSMTFQECGVVSMNIIELVDLCNEAFGIRIKASEVFGYPVIADFISHIEKLTAAKNRTAAGGRTPEFDDITIDQAAKNRTETGEREDIAIVGMSCRFPNGANSAEEYWKMLIDGVDGITEVPKERWDKDRYYSENKNEPGKMYCRQGGFLNIPVSDFDAKFFNISPKEAVEIDPHSRMLLELTYEAFENGGMDITEYNKTRTGVFIGAATGDYSLASVSSGDLQNIDSYSLTGVCTSTVCGRISYTFGFQGTCMTVNTACSSALTALHTAVNAIHAGDVDAAVVGGVSLMLSPAVSVAFSKLQAVSPNGHSRSFDADADGYARGEGAGVILLKRLSDARRDHDHIFGVIKATGANQDGHSNGLTAPNGEAQKQLILDTLRRNHLEPDSIGYVEAHGTGTPLGDPIEVNALIDAYCADRQADNPLLIGSVKSNIGHLEAASGMAAIIKVLLCFQHKMIPGNLNFGKPNPQIRWKDAPIQVVGSNTEWTGRQRPRRAAVDSFGFGGSNAHVIIEEYGSDRETPERSKHSGGNYFLKLSAKSDRAVRKLASEYIRLIARTPESGLEEVLATANLGRADYACRVAVSGADKDGLLEGLMKVVNEPSAKTKRPAGIAFLFTGQGSQYPGMASGLYENNAVFRRYMQQCDAMFYPYLLTSLCELVYNPKTKEETVNDTAYAQPLIFSVEYALAKMWMEYGITPAMVIGHSIGEYAAAVIAGGMSLETAVELVACRGRLMGAVKEDGTMAAVFAGKSVVAELLDGVDGCAIAVLNAETNTVVSGRRAQVELVMQKAKERGIRAKELVVSNAFHSPLMEQAAKDFALIANRGTYKETAIPFISTVYARKLGAGEVLDGDYWCGQIMRPVNFYESVLAIEKPENNFFLEIGATNTLSALADLILDGRAECAPSLVRGQDDSGRIGMAAAKMYQSGFSFNWEAFLGIAGKDWVRSFTLPVYPFERIRYWKELHYDRKENAEISGCDIHSLLGQRIESVRMEETVVFRRIYHSDRPFFMGEHIIYDTPIAPAASYVSLIISAMKEIRAPRSITIQNMELREPMIIREDETREVQVCIERAYDKECGFLIASRLNDKKRAEWTVHTKGTVLVGDMEYLDLGDSADIDAWENTGYDELASPSREHLVYGAMELAGFALGAGFRRVVRSRCRDGKGVCVVEPGKDLGFEEEYCVYPGIVDSVFHSMLCVSLADGFGFEGKKTVIPYFITRFSFNYREFEQLWCDSYARIENNSMMGGTKAYNSRGELVIAIDQMMTKLTTEENLITNRLANHNWYYQEDWKKAAAPPAAECGAEKFYLITDAKELFAKELEFWKGQKKEVEAIDPKAFEAEKSRILEEISQAERKTRFLYGVGCSDQTVCGPVEEECLRLLVALVHEIQQYGVQTLCTVRVVTRYGCNFRNRHYNLSQSLLWGFMRGMSMELPEVCAGIVDLEEIGSDDSETQFASLMIGAQEAEICVRGGDVYCSSVEKLSNLAEQNKKPERALSVSAEKTYVIAGGTGALGRYYMEALQKAGARHFAVICRKEPAKEVRENFGELEKEGVSVRLFYGDICDKVSAARLMAQIGGEMPAVGGIVNAAGALRDKMIRDLSWEDYQAVLNPKVYGSINLYAAAEEIPLDFFLFLSSITSVLGNIGQSNYAAANYFENMFASYLGAQGQNGCAICWGPWLGDGMAKEDATRKNMEVMGIHGFAPAQAVLALEEFLDKPYRNLMIADIDWDRFAENAGNPALKSRLASLTRKTADRETPKADWDVTGMTDEEIRTELAGKLCAICMDAMGYNGDDGIETDVSLMELGADSLMMFSVRSEINRLLRIDMNVSVLYTYDTVDKLTDYLLREYLAGAADSADDVSAPSAVPAQKPKILFFPYAGGSVYQFVKWKNRLQDRFDVLLMEYPGRGGKAQEPFADTIEELVGEMIAATRDTLDGGEYYLFGHSLGAVVAYEFMVQTKRQNLPLPKKAFLSGREPVCFCKISANTDSLSDMQFLEVMSRYGGIPDEFYRDEEVRELFLPVLRADFRLLERYLYGTHEEKVGCELVILYGENDTNTPENEMERWREYSEQKVGFYSFAGTHFYCMEDENTEKILALIRKLCGGDR